MTVFPSLLARHRLELIGEGLAGHKLRDILHCGLPNVGEGFVCEEGGVRGDQHLSTDKQQQQAQDMQGQLGREDAANQQSHMSSSGQSTPWSSMSFFKDTCTSCARLLTCRA